MVTEYYQKIIGFCLDNKYQHFPWHFIFLKMPLLIWSCRKPISSDNTILQWHYLLISVSCGEKKGSVSDGGDIQSSRLISYSILSTVYWSWRRYEIFLGNYIYKWSDSSPGFISRRQDVNTHGSRATFWIIPSHTYFTVQAYSAWGKAKARIFLRDK